MEEREEVLDSNVRVNVQLLGNWKFAIKTTKRPEISSL